MNDATKAPERIWAWSEDCGDVCVNEWVPDDPDCLGSYAEEAQTYILATPAALAASPEVAALIREAEARGMERAADMLLGSVPREFGDHRDYRKAIRAEAAALRGEKEPK